MGQKNQLWWDIPAIESFNLNRDIYEVPRQEYREILDELVNLLDLKDVLHQQVRRLSLGQRMKCELVAALVHTPKVLFLDEPTLGLDVVTQQKIREFIKIYNKRHNATVMLTSHYMDDVKEVCDRVIIIDKGVVLFDGKINSLIQKYATHKTLGLTFAKAVSEGDIGGYGEIVQIAGPSVTLKVPAKQTSKVAAELLAEFNVTDVTISEPRLEDIVRMMFA
jgi:ABC-2 type transport system ATP-binding protein